MKKKLVVVISIGMILICGSVFAITAVVNSNYEKESIEKSSKVINNNVEENLDSIYSKSDTEVIINNLELTVDLCNNEVAEQWKDLGEKGHIYMDSDGYLKL